MNGGYVKLYDGILSSSVWTEPATTRVVWITMLALADKNGKVSASPSGLARLANVSIAECRSATDTLEAPDLESKSPEWGGRRIEKVEGGWIILNYLKYREMRSPKQIATAKRQQLFRDRHAQGSGDGDEGVTEGYVTQGNAPAVAVAVDVPVKGEKKAAPLKTGEAAVVLTHIRRLAESTQNAGQGAVRFIRREKVAELGSDVLLAYDAVGGADRILSATGKEHSFLARDFASALEAARQ